ncbi:MAG: transcriptional regulator NrdR [Planctomycetota bacterium]
MKCPTCGSLEDRVIDSRTAGDGSAIRRRRVCQSCSRRFTTYERIEWNPPLVIKKDTSREPFSRDKVLSGLRKACEKRPVPADRLELAVDKVERMVQESGETEILAVRIGEMLVEELKQIDQVAYVRFASVYRQFRDARDFVSEVKSLGGR